MLSHSSFQSKESKLAFLLKYFVYYKHKPMEGESIISTCYFCKELDISSCVTRSLYHKYNDSTNKVVQFIDQIISPNKQRTFATRKFAQIKHLNDDNDHLNHYLQEGQATSQYLELLEYYKFRKYVPVFVKSTDNYIITEQLHIFYYDKLKLYYNSIKKKLNITIDQSSASSSLPSFVSRSENTDQSKILEQITTKLSKETFRNYETESKALENLLNILKKKEDQLKKIKSLRTEDCNKQLKPVNPFKDHFQKKSNMISFYAEARLGSKKGKKNFFRYIDEIKQQRKQQNLRSKSNKKVSAEQSKATIYYQSIKSRNSSEILQKLRKDQYKNQSTSQQRIFTRNKAFIDRSQRKLSCQNLVQKNVIKSLPKVQMQFCARPARSFSSNSLANKNQGAKTNAKVAIIKRDLNWQDQVMSRLHPLDVVEQKKKKRGIRKTPLKGGEIDQNDNLASINKKKIEQLKLKSQRKKQGGK